MAGGAGVARAQGQVHGITAQKDSVLNGHHVVRVIRAAVLAKDLHGDNLGVRGHALHQNLVQSLGVGAISTGDIGVGCGNACHVGTVLGLGGRVMGNLQAPVHVIKGKGQLGIAVQILCRGVHMKLTQHRGNLRLIQKVQLFQVGFLRHTGCLGLLRQGVPERALVKRLMVRVGTGVYNGNPAARAGISSGPGSVGANHGGRGTHMRIGRQIGLHHIGLILGLQEDSLHLRDSLNGLNLAIGHIGRDEVGRHGQIPNHVQLFAGGALNLLLHLGLLLDQRSTVGHGGRVAPHVLCLEARFQGGLLFQNNGNTHQVRTGVAQFLLFFRLLLQQGSGHRAVVHLREADPISMGGAGCTCWGGEAPQQS